MPVSLDYDDTDLGGMTWEAAEDALANAAFVVLPTGSIEQHSVHLPVSVDTLRAERLSQALVELASDWDIPMVRLPTLPYGYSEHHMNYAGTVTLQAETYIQAIVDIGRSLAVHGAPRLVFLNCHGGNREPLKLAADRIQREHDLPTHFVHWTDFARADLEERFGEGWGHAGEHETSVIELFYPDLVVDERKESQTRRAEYETKQYAYLDELTEQGGLGDPTASDPSFVAEVVDSTTERILEGLLADR